MKHRGKFIAAALVLMLAVAFIPACAFAGEESTAVTVTNETELIAACEKGGEIVIDGTVELQHPLVITEDVILRNGEIRRGAPNLGDLVTVDGASVYARGVAFRGGEEEYQNQGRLLAIKNSGIFYGNVVYFINNDSAEDGGAVHVGPGCRLFIDGADIDNNRSTGNGGAICAEGNAKTGERAFVSMRNVFVRSNEAENGGAFSASYANVDMYDLTINQNCALDCGGAVNLTNGSVLRFTFSSMTENTAGASGGAIYADSDGTKAVLQFGFCGKNICEENGGAVCLEDGAAAEGLQMNLSDNRAGGAGGAVAVIGKETAACMEELQVMYNSAKSGGFLYSEGEVNVREMYSGSNTADELGSLICADKNTAFTGFDKERVFDGSDMKRPEWSKVALATDGSSLPVNECPASLPRLERVPVIFEVDIADIPAQKYSEKPVEPELSLVKFTDLKYEAFFCNNTNPGQARVIINLTGDAIGFISKSFDIELVPFYAGGNYYGSLEDAVSAMGSGGDETVELKLMGDYTISEYEFPAGAYSIDLNGHALMLKRDLGADYGLTVSEDAAVEIKNGTIRADDSNKENNWGLQRLMRNDGSLTLTDVALDGGNLIGTDDSGAFVNNGTALLQGNTSISVNDGDYAYKAMGGELTIDVSPEMTFDGMENAFGGDIAINSGIHLKGFQRGANFKKSQLQIRGGSFSQDVTEFCTGSAIPMFDEESGLYVLHSAGDVIDQLNGRIDELEEGDASNKEQIAALEAEKLQSQAKIALLENPVRPTATVSSAAGGKARVTLKWKSVEGASYIVNGAAVSGTSRTFTVDRGKTYTYKVQAKLTAGGQEVMGPTSSVTVKPEPKKVRLSSAKNVKARKIRTKWAKAAGAKYYQVSVSTSKSKTKIVKKKTAKLSYTKTKLKKGRTYYVKVRAVGANGTFGDWSRAKKIKIKK